MGRQSHSALPACFSSTDADGDARPDADGDRDTRPIAHISADRDRDASADQIRDAFRDRIADTDAHAPTSVDTDTNAAMKRTSTVFEQKSRIPVPESWRDLSRTILENEQIRRAIC